jgi:phosphohistidine phosphatase
MESQQPAPNDGAAPPAEATEVAVVPATRPRTRRVERAPSYALDLLIVRHGPAGDRDEWAKTGKDDDERPLTPRGTREMRRAARGLRQLVSEVDAIGTSPLVRARETAAILAEVYDVVPDEARSIGDGDRRAILRWVRSAAAVVAKKRGTRGGERVTIAVVGHEPDLSVSISWLLTGRAPEEDSPWVELKKGGACLLSFDGRPRPRQAHLRWLLTRSQLERVRR